jgi:hypothetical protein
MAIDAGVCDTPYVMALIDHMAIDEGVEARRSSILDPRSSVVG